MPNPSLFDALSSGAIVVTPNNRIARVIADGHDRAQAAVGRTVWPTPQAIPWSAWISALWQEAIAASAWKTPFSLLDPTQSLTLWQRAIESDAIELLDVAGAAERAADAWRVFHAYANPDESITRFGAAGDDAAAFARWARRFSGRAGELGAVDVAELPRRLVDALRRVPFAAGRAIVLAGFVGFTPQQTRLIEALRESGAGVEEIASPVRAGIRSRTQYATPTDELVAALQWARERVLADPHAHATIAVIDLRARFELAVRLADEILRPHAVATATLAGSRPYNVSLAPPLLTHPLAVTAFDLLEIATRSLPLARAAALARSPYLAGGTTGAARRAQCERDWRVRSTGAISLNALIAALPQNDPLRDGLMSMWQQLRRAAPRSPREWADLIVEMLRLCGWPGSDTQSSAVFQAHSALLRAFAQWRALALVEPRMQLAVALASLREHCARTSFQPESAPARIQILGVLEAAGLEFDGLWLAGMDADAWPAKVRPAAFLPPAWQRQRGVVQASAERSLARAALLTEQLAASASEVVASHVTTTEQPPRNVSPLCNWTLQTRACLPTPTMQAIAAAPRLARIADATLPALPNGTKVGGGVRVIEMQSDCPFRAAASRRLGAEAWPRASVGLSAIERGNLVHAAMASLWSSLGEQSELLLRLEDATLQARIDDAVASALRETIAESRWRSLPPVITTLEAPRLARLIADFLRQHEGTRPPFRVLHNEWPLPLAIGGLELGLRIDRVDAIDGGLAIIDYKTGVLPPVGQWLLERPVAPQTGLYTLAASAIDPGQRVCAVALVSIKSGALDVRGIAVPNAIWKGLSTAARASRERIADFASLEVWWQQRFTALAQAFARGDAAVLPRQSPRPCEHCDFKPLCRIALHDVDAVDDIDDPVDSA